MALVSPAGADVVAAWGVVVPPVSWPGLSRPSTTFSVAAPPVVDGWHRPGHDTGVSGPAASAPMLVSPLIPARPPLRRLPRPPAVSGCAAISGPAAPPGLPASRSAAPDRSPTAA